MKTKPPALTLGERIRTRREALDLTQTQLAAAIGAGVTQTYVSNWERGNGPHVSRLAAIAAALGISVGELVG